MSINVGDKFLRKSDGVRYYKGEVGKVVRVRGDWITMERGVTCKATAFFNKWAVIKPKYLENK